MKEHNLDEGAVRQQMLRILAAPSFQNSITLSRFLGFIVEETLAGRQAELKEYTIALKVLSKKPGFNPQADPIVRIHAGRLRRSLNEYYQKEGEKDTLLIAIPKGGYVPGFQHRQATPAETATAITADQPYRKRITVAVLPFANIGAEHETVAFADALAEHISTELTRYSELSVISYYSCRNIIGRISDIREAGLLLDAMYMLTGTVQTGHQRLRIRVQLILAQTREQVWANTYERNSTPAHFFDVQDDIVWRVVSQTAGHYGAISRNVSRLFTQNQLYDLEVYNAIFWYYHFVGDLSLNMFYKAEQAMQRAVQTDPSYALGWAVLGEIWVGGYFMGHQSRLAENQLERAVECGKNSVRIDPACQHAYQTIALANMFLKNTDESLKAIEEWQKIKPAEAGIMGAMGFVLICCGAYEKGYRMLDESVLLNPYYQWWFNAGFSFYHFYQGDFTSAFYWAEKMNTPQVPWELLLKIACCAELNLQEAGEKYCHHLKQAFPMIPAMLDEYLAAVLRDDLLVAKLRQALKRAGI